MQDNSTPELSDDEPVLSSTSQSRTAPVTPIHLRSQAAHELSPPDSRGQSGLNKQTSPTASTMPTAESLNANGKRTFDAATGVAAGSSASASDAKATHLGKHPAGYVWDKDEDAPGYAWNNEKAQQEALRAMSQIIDVDMMIKGKVVL